LDAPLDCLSTLDCAGAVTAAAPKELRFEVAGMELVGGMPAAAPRSAGDDAVDVRPVALTFCGTDGGRWWAGCALDVFVDTALLAGDGAVVEVFGSVGPSRRSGCGVLVLDVVVVGLDSLAAAAFWPPPGFGCIGVDVEDSWAALELPTDCGGMGVEPAPV